MRPSDGERGTETAKTSTRSPNDRRTTTGTNPQNGAAILETIEHEVEDPRGISSQVQEEQGRTRVCKALSSSAAKPYRLCVHSQNDQNSSPLQQYIGVFTSNKSLR